MLEATKTNTNTLTMDVAQLIAFSGLEFSRLLLEGYPLWASLFMAKTAGITTLFKVDEVFRVPAAVTTAAAAAAP